MRVSFVVLALACAPSITMAQSAPDEITPLNPDVSGLWRLEPFPVPDGNYTDRPRNCIDEYYRLSNFPKYGASFVQLWRTGQRTEAAGQGFNPERLIVYSYEGRLHHTQGYGGGRGMGNAVDYHCASEVAEYRLTGELRWNVDTGDIELGFVGPIASAVRFQHGNRASMSGYFVDAEGKVLYGNIGASGLPGRVAPAQMVNYGVMPSGCDYYLHEHYRDWELSSCTARGGWPHYLRRVDAPAELEDKIAGVLVEERNGVRTSTVIPDAVVTVYHQDIPIRAQTNGETDAAYARFLRQQLINAPIAATTRSGSDGRFEVELPIFKTHAGRRRLDRRVYAIVVTEARRWDDVLGQPRATYYFSTARAGLTTPDEVEVVLRPVSGLVEKIAITERLIDASPNRYRPIEEPVKAYVERLTAGTPTPEQVEGVQRALMAETVALPAVDYARTLIDLSFDPFATLVTELAKKIVGDNYGRSQEVGKAAEELKNKSTQAFRAAQARGGNALSGLGENAGAVAETARERMAKNIDGAVVFWLRNIKGALTLVGEALKGLMEEAGIEAPIAQQVTGVLVEFSLGLAEAILTGDPTELGGSFLNLLIKAAKERVVAQLVDGPISYCALTEGSLSYSSDRMMRWGVADPTQASADIDRAYHEAARRMHEDMNFLLEQHYALRAIADSSGTIKDIFEYVPTPATQAVAKGAFATQLLSEATIMVGGMAGAFITLPLLVDRGARLSFGERSLRGMQAPDGWVGTSTAVQTDLVDALGQLSSAAGYTANSTRNGAFGHIIADIAAADPTKSIPAAVANLERASGRYQAALLGLRDDGRELRRWASISNAQLIDTMLEGQRISAEAFAITNDLVDGVYRDELDANLTPRRLALMSRTLALKNRTFTLSSALQPLLSGWQQLSIRPAIYAGALTIESAVVPGSELRTRSPETFTVRARVENVTPVAISGAIARLTLRAPVGAARIIGAADVAVPMLAADDGAANSGPDEQAVSWTVEVTAPIDAPGAVMVVVDLVDTETPARFVSAGSIGVIEIDPALGDTDGDLMPDAWERRLGLNVGMDDRTGDADSDGISNFDELQRFTKPDTADTDADGLSDGDEIRGATGRLPTDPTNADTDGDGVDDAMDGDPRNVSSTSARAPAEPEVRLSECAVALKVERREFDKTLAYVGVENAGTSSLSWTVEGDTRGAVRVLPSSPTIIDGPARLTLIAERASPDPIELWVTDVSGAVRDKQRLLVYVGRELPPDACRGVVPSGDAGVMPGMDGAVARDDAGRPIPGADAGVPAPPRPEGDSSGCGCASAAPGDLGVWAVIAGLALARRRRR